MYIVTLNRHTLKPQRGDMCNMRLIGGNLRYLKIICFDLPDFCVNPVLSLIEKIVAYLSKKVTEIFG